MSLTVEEVREFTMIALDQPPFWPRQDDSFRFTVTVDGTNDRPLTVSFPNGAYYSFLNGFGGKIEWGDGSSEEIEEREVFSDISHSYSISGTYQIRMKGHFQYQVNASSWWYNHSFLNNQKQLDSIDSKFPIAEVAYRYYDEDRNRHWGWEPIHSDHIIYVDGLFSGCNNLKSVPLGLFKNIPKQNFGGTVKRLFYGCHLLQEIPYDLFSYWDNIRNDAYACFANCQSIIKIPKDLFKNFHDVVSFENFFWKCYALKSIPDNLFYNCTLVTNFHRCFSECSSLEVIPEKLFESCTLVTDFQACFSGCSSLLTIPFDLFDHCTNVTTFSGCFSGCSSLLTIPSGLFDYCTNVTNFNSCFDACYALKSIPDNLFDHCTNVTTFSGCFHACSSLTSIPFDLFDHCPDVTTFSACFARCSSLTFIPFHLFDNCVYVNNFQSCFEYCSEVTSSVPELWITHSSAMHTECYYGCNNAVNWEDIPNDWKSMPGPI